MAKSDVRPNSKFFDDLASKDKQSVVAQSCGISPYTLRLLRRGVMVSRGTIRTVAKSLNRAVEDLIFLPGATFVPSDPSYFQSLKFGYYLDNNRYGDGNATWFKEAVTLRVVASEVSGVIHVIGEVVNEFGEVFNVSGTRLGDHHFSLTGSSTPGGLGFDGTFSLQVNNVLCGIWSGINHLGLAIGVYRMFLSPHELTKDDIKRLTLSAKIDSVVESRQFGWK